MLAAWFPLSLSLLFSLCACCVSCALMHTPHLPPLYPSSRVAASLTAQAATLCVVWIHHVHRIPKGCPVAVTDDPAWQQGGITYRDSHCLPFFNLRLLGRSSSVWEDPRADTIHTSCVCVFIESSLPSSQALAVCAKSVGTTFFSVLENCHFRMSFVKYNMHIII